MKRFKGVRSEVVWSSHFSDLKLNSWIRRQINLTFSLKIFYRGKQEWSYRHLVTRVHNSKIRKFESSNNFDNKFEFDRRIPKPSYSNTMNNISELFVSSNQLYRVCHYIYWCANIFNISIFCRILWCKKLTFLMDMFWYD